MSGKKNKQRRRELREKKDEFEADMSTLLENGVEVGMSIEQAADLMKKAAIEIRHEMTRVGAIDKMPWGVVCQPAPLMNSLKDATRQIEVAFAAVDDVDVDASPIEHIRVLAELSQTLIGTAGCALLVMQSTPIPYDIVKHFIVRKSNERDPDAH